MCGCCLTIHEIIARLKQGWPEKNYEQVASWLLREAANEQQLEQWLHELLVLKKPLAYVLGYVPFCNIQILVEPPMLIPRPETEEWVMHLIERLRAAKRPLHILDVCSGSGCIALAIAQAFPNSTVVGLDISPQAIKLARCNQQVLKLPNISFVQSDLFTAVVGQRFDVIISNPPYVTPDEWQGLASIVRDWEDRQALVADHSGLAVLNTLIQQAQFYLADTEPGIPQVILEIGHQQAEAVCTKFRACGYNEVAVERDLAGLDRVVMARYRKGSICKMNQKI